MAIKTILIVPAAGIRNDALERPIISRLTAARRYLSPASGYDAEIQFYGDIPAILGAERTFVLGGFLPHLHAARVPAHAPYPSCHGVPPITAVRAAALETVLSAVDAVLVSTRAGGAGERAIRAARKRDIPVVLLDFPDHWELYGAPDARARLAGSFQAGRDFDLLFMKDLPRGEQTDAVLPLAPSPVRPSSYVLPTALKSSDIFFSGRTRTECQDDRPEVVDLIRGAFKKARIIEHDVKRQSFTLIQDYWTYLAEARMALSPSGKSWDSFRHAEVGLAPLTALIAPKPYIETTGPALEDGRNAILYDIEFRGGRFHLKNGAELVEKIRSYLARPQAIESLARAWARDVRAGHTILARSRYILNEMERVFA
ncbi:glycosyltransferase family 1 protein [Candidatus Parcubacteria bacterium]|nr:MAG: glycosyltransferase family 1 protein [Candidatus Parcubacteria bacterium]